MNGLSLDQEQLIKELIQAQNLIAAIKMYREMTGVGLKEAKDAVEAMIAGKPLLAPAQPPIGGVNLALETQIIQLLKEHKKIEAIRMYREVHNCGLKDAKDAVDAIQERMWKDAHQGISPSLDANLDPFADERMSARRRLVISTIVILAIILAGLGFILQNGF